MPAKAEEKSRAGAKAFVRHWIATLNYAGPAGSPEDLREITSPDCTACVAIANFIDEVYSAGGRIEGKGWTVKKLSVVSGTPNEAVVVDALVRVRPQEVKPASDEPAETFQGGRRLKTFWVKRKGDGWIVTRLDQPS